MREQQTLIFAVWCVLHWPSVLCDARPGCMRAAQQKGQTGQALTAIEGPSASTEVGTAPAFFATGQSTPRVQNITSASPSPPCRAAATVYASLSTSPGLTCAFWMVRTSSNKAVKRILSSKIPQGT
jgi:hypothetical protein